ncbi:cell division protein FtsZ [Roseovarius sp. 217]|nr:cell division protein FtsZ [Roseovarius sp. 217]
MAIATAKAPNSLARDVPILMRDLTLSYENAGQFARIALVLAH